MVRRPLASSFSAMAGPTPRSWMTGVESGSAGVFGAAAASLDMGASLPPPPDIPCARAAISSGTGSSAPSSRTRAAIAFRRSSSPAASNPRTLAASRSRGPAEAAVA